MNWFDLPMPTFQFQDAQQRLFDDIVGSLGIPNDLFRGGNYASTVFHQPLFAMPMMVSPFLCQPEFVRWRRKHRRSRINRKWQKKYGAIYRCRGVVYQIGDSFLMCPCAANAVKKETA